MKCKPHAASLEQGKSICLGCGARLANEVTRAADKVIDLLVMHVDQNSTDQMFRYLVEGCLDMKATLEQAGHSVQLQDVAATVQLRSAQIIKDLREALTRGHG